MRGDLQAQTSTPKVSSRRQPLGSRLSRWGDRAADARGMGEVQFGGEHFGVHRS